MCSGLWQTKSIFCLPPRQHKETTLFWLVGHNSSIVSDRPKWFECAFCFLVHGIRITNLVNRSYQHLRRKLRCGSERMIHLVVQFDFIENLLLPCHLRNSTTSSISFLDGLKEQCGLLIARQKLDFQSHFNNAKIIKVAI